MSQKTQINRDVSVYLDLLDGYGFKVSFWRLVLVRLYGKGLPGPAGQFRLL
jgi:hypothetical protein